MGSRDFFATGYRVGGAIALTIGIGHFFMPIWGYDGAVLRSIPKIPSDHFVYVGTYAIGIFLLSAGVMSLHLAQVGCSPTARLFALLQMVFWAGRILLELLFPSHLRIFFLNDPSVALCTISAMALASYMVAFIATAKMPARGSANR